MAATESRTGFRLPWSTEEKTTGQREDAPSDADRPSDDAAAATADAAAAAADAATTDATPADATMPSADTSADTATVSGTDPEHADPPTAAVVTEEASVHPTVSHDVQGRAKDAQPKKPSKFMADLTRAMQAAAESSRTSTLEQFQAEAKSHIEEVHARSADEATELRKTADDDIVTIREWSKAELARVREETDRKITTRKADLEGELEDHNARIERRIERLQTRVAAFETEMEQFFEKLLNQDDPAEFAAMAEHLPEPPPFDFEAIDHDAPTSRAGGSSAVTEPEVAPDAAIDAASTVESETPTTETEPSTEPDTEARAETAIEPDGDETAYAVQDDPAAVEAAMAAIEAAYKAAGATDPETQSDAPAAEAGSETEADAADAPDPRLAALGWSPDLGAAEAEAAASAADSSDEEIPTIDDEALANRLAGLVPAGSSAPAPRAPAPKAAANSQVVVTGLVSVASIASFKRHIGRIAGVQSVGVSSGPDGEFVFKVAHGSDVVLADAIPSLPGFEARVTGTSDGVVNVSARDPESEG
jgi:hypothetical protein